MTATMTHTGESTLGGALAAGVRVERADMETGVHDRPVATAAVRQIPAGAVDRLGEAIVFPDLPHKCRQSAANTPWHHL